MDASQRREQGIVGLTGSSSEKLEGFQGRVSMWMWQPTPLLENTTDMQATVLPTLLHLHRRE